MWGAASVQNARDLTGDLTRGLTRGLTGPDGSQPHNRLLFVAAARARDEHDMHVPWWRYEKPSATSCTAAMRGLFARDRRSVGFGCTHENPKPV